MSLKIPDKLKDLPVLKTLPSIDLTADFILTASTGSGKTTLIPAIISDTRKRLVIIRQPTRGIAKMIYRTLSEFYEGQLFIGIITAEDRDTEMRFLNSYNIIIVTDGILSTILKKIDTDRCTIVFDEIHWASSPLEVELSLVEAYKRKNPLLQIVLLSASIDPYLFVQYFERMSPTPVKDSILRDICKLSNSELVNSTPQPQSLKVHYSEGTAFPIEKHIIRVPDINSIDDDISKFCYRMKNNKTFGLVFLSTRNEISEASKKFSYIAPTFYCHADTSIDELMTFFKLNAYGSVFATVALSTSVTLPFTEVLITDKSNDAEFIEAIEQRINIYGCHCGFNEFIQKNGRVGRMFPGISTIITSRDITWDDIHPTNIIPPLSKELPVTATLIVNSHGIDIRKANLLTKLSETQMSKSINCLTQYKFLDETGTITPRGSRALALPLDVHDAKILLSSPTSFISATAAYLSFPQGMFYIVDSSASATIRKTLYSNYTFNSIPITKISLLQDAISNKHNLKTWCHDNGLNYKRITSAIFTFHKLGEKFNKDPSSFDEELLSLDFSPDSTITNSYRTLIYMLQPKFPAPLDGSGFGIHDGIKKHYSFFSDLEFFHVEYPNAVYKVSARFSLFQAKGKPDIYGRLSDATIPLSLGAGATA